MSDPVLFLVPARGGSRRIPGKNLRPVAGIPLVAGAVWLARRAAAGIPGGPHAVVCSTDDHAIAEVAAAWHAEVPFLRPAAIADERASSVDVALHALDRLAADGRRFRALVLLQPTSPLTDPADVRAAVARFDTTGLGIASVTSAHPAAWHQAFDEAAGGTLVSAGVPDAEHLLSGAFYVVGPTALRAGRRFIEPGHTLGFGVPPERSVDVDEELDLLVADAVAARRPVRPVAVAGHRIGAGPCFVIAEAGVNHNGDLGLAHRLVDAAGEAGADAVKFQTFDPSRLAAAGAPLADYQRAAGEAGAGQREMLERLALPREGWAALREHASDRGMVFLSSPFDEASADLLEQLDVAAFKVPSGELTNHPFLAHLARKGRPLLVSTGMADMREVADALEVIEVAGGPPVALFHCVSSYPAPPEDANLRAIGSLRAAFGVPAGWSDHSLGIELPTAAAALGADLLEKHLTLDRTLPGPDHAASLEPDAFRSMVAAVRAVAASLGSGEKIPTAAELATAALARKSLHWRRARSAGASITADDLVALRPGMGVPPARLADVVGRSTTRPVREGDPLAPSDVEGFR